MNGKDLVDVVAGVAVELQVHEPQEALRVDPNLNWVLTKFDDTYC